jgi:hypothetical protein
MTAAAILLVLCVALQVVSIFAIALLIKEHRHMSTQLDQILNADTATLTAVQGVAAQLTTDVNTLIGLIQNGDPTALAAAQALGTNLSALQTGLQNIDTAAQGAGGAPQTPGATP